jgi:hypothetical protein
MLKELQKKRSDLKDISEESKDKRNALNAEASALAAKPSNLHTNLLLKNHPDKAPRPNRIRPPLPAIDVNFTMQKER